MYKNNWKVQLNVWSPWRKGKSSTGCPEKWDKITSLVKSIKASWRRWHSKLSAVLTRRFGRGSCNTSWCNFNTGPYNHHCRLCQLGSGRPLPFYWIWVHLPPQSLQLCFSFLITYRSEAGYKPHISWLSLKKFLSLSLVTQSCPTLATPWTVACQAPLSMGFSRQEY